MAAEGLTPAEVSLFWYWINERHAIYLSRAAGNPKPWTSDGILRSFKFTNVFRQLDRGTEWLTANVIEPHRHDPADLLFFNVAWYRMFNWTGTGALLGWRTEWDQAAVALQLKATLAAGGQVFTGAHIVRSAFGMPKIDSIVAVCADLYEARADVVRIAASEHRLQAVFERLIEVDYVGGFMGYEIVTDLRHTPLLDDAIDINTWANVGPGALRGLRRLYPGMPGKDGLQAMVGLLEQSRAGVGRHVPPLELRDIEHSLCEFDKYCRVLFGEGKPRGVYQGEGELL